MADEAPAGDAGDELECPPPKCPVCPLGLPGWMATFSDLVTLLLTFFVLLLSFAKTETAKYEAALGSIRNAFGGNVFKQGKVIERGKSADNSPTMFESQTPVKPFPIEFLTMEGLLDKHEVNRSSTEVLNTMKSEIEEYDLGNAVDIYEINEGIRVVMKDKIFFKKGKIKIEEISVEVFQKVVKMVSSTNWTVFVQGHASRGETSADGKIDAMALSSMRSAAVTRSLIRRGIRPNRITTIFYGDARPQKKMGKKEGSESGRDRRVEFILRKTDLKTPAQKVDP